MEALHAGAGSTHSAGGPRTGVLRTERSVAFGGVGGMRAPEVVGVDLCLGTADTAGGFELRHGAGRIGIDEPVSRRHGRAVVEQRGVANDEGTTRSRAHDDLEVGSWRAAQQLGEEIDLGG